MRQPIINDAGYKTIWCPVCCLDAPKSALAYSGMHSWVVRASDRQPANLTLVCNYELCPACNQRYGADDASGKRAVCNAAEINLLKKYPTLCRKLPADYAVGRQ